MGGGQPFEVKQEHRYRLRLGTGHSLNLTSAYFIDALVLVANVGWLPITDYRIRSILYSIVTTTNWLKKLEKLLEQDRSGVTTHRSAA